MHRLYASTSSHSLQTGAEAIFEEDDVPAGQEAFIALNAELSQEWPVITQKKDPLPDAEEWDGKENKLEYLER